MLTKENINEIKFSKNNLFDKIINDNISNSGNLIFVLENLGRLPSDFDPNSLIKLTSHKDPQVRILSVKNLAKLSKLEFLELFKNIAISDADSSVRREAVSAIGRIRDPINQKILIDLLNDPDPKIVCQAIRGLLVFKGNILVDASLNKLINHQNEVVRAAIHKEYYSNNKIEVNSQHHCDSFDYLKNVVVNSDVREVLKLVPDESIHLTFTSPPYYNARDYSIYPSYKAYLKFLEEVFLETYRITKEGRFLVLNTSPIIIPRISRAHSSKRYPIPFDIHHYLTEMGWEFIDDIIWMKPEYSVKNRVGGFQQHRKPLAYKPNSITEYLMVYRKGTDKLLDWNIHQYNNNIIEKSKVLDGFETTNVWKIDPKFDKIHSAVFPFELCKRVIEYYSYKNDLIFDPFGGSGTLGRAANILGRFYFLTEQETKYFNYMQTFLKQSELTDKFPPKFLNIKQFKGIII